MRSAAATKFRASVCQIELTDSRSVLRQCEQAFQDCSDSDLLVFPEYVSHGDGVAGRGVNATVTREIPTSLVVKCVAATPTFTALRQLAERHRKAAVFGCLEQEGQMLFSRAYFFDPEGGQLSWYDKAHIHWTEPFLTAGERIEPIATRFGKIGLLLCYDLAFAEAPRTLGVQGATVLFAPAAVPRSFDWRYVHRRLAGAAIQNQFYILGAHVGYSELWEMGGHSAIFGPDGAVLAQVNREGYDTASQIIDPRALDEWRDAERIEPFRRPGLYAPLARKKALQK